MTQKLLLSVGFVLICAALNVARALFSDEVHFPLYMDSFATIAVSAAGGFVPSVLCALLTNGALTLLGRLHLVFMVCQVMTAVLSSLIFYAEKRSLLIGNAQGTAVRTVDLDAFMKAGIASSVSNGIFGSVFAAVLHYNLTAVEQGILVATGNVTFANLMGGLLLNLVDKAFAAFIAYGMYVLAVRPRGLSSGSKFKSEYVFFVVAVLALGFSFSFGRRAERIFAARYERAFDGGIEMLAAVRGEEAEIQRGFDSLAYTSFALMTVSLAIMQLRSSRRKKLLDLMRAKAETERAFSRDLHDGAAQLLAAVRLSLEAGETEKAMAFTDEAIGEVRELIGTLRLDLSADFVRLVQDYARVFSESWHIAVDVFEASDTARDFSDEVKRELLRIVQEALSNAAHHARASRIAIKMIGTDADFALSVCDNGIGFACAAQTATHIGLESMRERARAIGADLQIESDEHGTTVSVLLTAGEKRR